MLGKRRAESVVLSSKPPNFRRRATAPFKSQHGRSRLYSEVCGFMLSYRLKLIFGVNLGKMNTIIDHVKFNNLDTSYRVLRKMTNANLIRRVRTPANELTPAAMAHSLRSPIR